MKESTPIVYVHKGTHKYLEISIEQSLKNNERIILIGDTKNLSIAKKYNIEHYMYDDYNINNFRKYYILDKPNTNYEYELMCYERWFVIHEIMKKYKIKRCLYLDSDILYYGNVDEEFNRIERYGNFELAYPNFSGHTTYIFSQKFLEHFCAFIMQCYKDEDMYKKLLNWPLIYQPGISDMSMFQLYKFYYPEKVFDLTKNYGDNIVYDGFLNIGEGYKTIFGKKFFNLKNSKAFFLKDGKEYETKTLHFQMHMKNFMGLVFNNRLLIYHFYLLGTYIVEWLYWHFGFVRKLRKRWKDSSLFK